MAEGRLKVKCYYVWGTTVPFEEDSCHEFKGHRNICVEELPPWTQESKNDKASRRAVSRTLNAFLNTGKGGTVYLGIVDSGIVHGLKLSQFQKDHIVGSLDDLFSRYNPPVKPHRYRVRFVPVVKSDSTPDEIITQCSFDSSETVDDKDRLRPHIYRNHKYCWCDTDSLALCNYGVMSPDYVIEIEIKPWNPNDPLNKQDACGSLFSFHPIHEDEEGTVYFRRQASLIKYSMTEVAQLTRQEVHETCQEEIYRLKREISLLKQSNCESGGMET
ncbi:hypothetical protein CHS0354_013469 [Potamilus streckersoni]|uniref:Schlafen AlbA-2 domain-containing protein n=1 Tax=Potamilus streckersoni TaxID=2493646 RepID=A0AAE0W9R4_9BIVA|nr:hypothetical protein CHS0354_013469 [Potamilus streckersoni]